MFPFQRLGNPAMARVEESEDEVRRSRRSSKSRNIGGREGGKGAN